MAKKLHLFIKGEVEKTLLIGIHAPYNRVDNCTPYYDEFLSLCKTNAIPTDNTLFIKLRTIDSAYFISKGKLAEITEVCKDQEIERVVISEQLTAQQERNLSSLLHCEIIDRTRLILDIFEKSAHSAEGKAQVAMALLHHKKSRLAGKGIHMGQQQGGAGFFSGPGETAKERETRHINEALLKLQKQLHTIEKSRDTQRKQRLINGTYQICLIGYTNSGKSTLLNALTHSDVIAKDALFATLDTTTRELFLEGKKAGVISDTVGFIQHLPHHLIEAFKSTLSELQYAHLLLHVVDIANPSWEMHIRVTDETLQELAVDKKVLYVFNKADHCEDYAQLEAKIEQYQPHILVSALSKESIETLKNFLRSSISSQSTQQA